MGPGSKNGVHYNTIDYSIPSGSFFADYVRGVSSELRSLGMGSVYWPGLRDGDWYSMTSKSGTGSGIKLSLVNASGLTRLQYAWGIGNGGGTYVRITNAATGLYIDGEGRTTSGATAGVASGSSNRYEQQWTVENDGSYVRIKNRATGLYLDGAGPHLGRIRGQPIRRQQQHEPAVVGADRRRQRAHQEPHHRQVHRRHGPHRQWI